MTMHKALNPRDDVNRLHVSRKEEISGHACIKDVIVASIPRLKDYIQKLGEKLITASWLPRTCMTSREAT